MAQGAQPLVLLVFATVPANPESASRTNGSGVVEPTEVGVAPGAPTKTTKLILSTFGPPLKKKKKNEYCAMSICRAQRP